MESGSETIVLITGANSGVGYATVIALARSETEKYHIILCSRSIKKGQAALESIKEHLAQSETEIQNTISVQQLDVTDQESITSAKTSIEENFGRLDILVNNAGVLYKPISYEGNKADGGTSPSELRSTFETNAIGPFLVTEAFLPLLKKSKHARIVHVSSDLGSFGTFIKTRFTAPSLSYRMSKAALDMLAVHQAISYESDEIKVAVYNPGYTVTDLGNPGMDSLAWKDFRRKNGARDADDSARALVDVIRGKKDDVLLDGIQDVDGGVLPW